MIGFARVNVNSLGIVESLSISGNISDLLTTTTASAVIENDILIVTPAIEEFSNVRFKQQSKKTRQKYLALRPILRQYHGDIQPYVHVEFDSKTQLLLVYLNRPAEPAALRDFRRLPTTIKTTKPVLTQNLRLGYKLDPKSLLDIFALTRDVLGGYPTAPYLDARSSKLPAWATFKKALGKNKERNAKADLIPPRDNAKEILLERYGIDLDGQAGVQLVFTSDIMQQLTGIAMRDNKRLATLLNSWILDRLEDENRS